MTKPNQDNDTVLEEQLAGMIRYRVEQEHQKYAHRDYVEKYESKDFWIEAIARKLSNTLVQDVIKAHYKQKMEEAMRRGVSVRKIPDNEVARFQQKSYNWIHITQPGYYELSLSNGDVDG